MLEYNSPPSSRRRGIMLCYPFEERRLTRWPTPYLVQPKLDGERCRALFDSSGKVSLLSSEEKPIISVPHITRALETLKLQNVELDGELYVHGMPFEEIHSRVSRKVNQHERSEEIEYHVFDLVDGQRQGDRLVSIMTMKIVSENIKCIKAVPYNVANSLSEIMWYYEYYLKKGYEGFIVRHAYAPYVRTRSTNIMKFKPKKEDYYTIVGWEEEVSIHGERKGTLGALKLHSPDFHSSLINTFNVGTGFTAEQRRELWKVRDSLPGKIARIKYQHLTSAHIPRFPVFVEIVEVPK